MLTINDWNTFAEQAQQELAVYLNMDKGTSKVDSRHFAELLGEHFDLEEFKSLCFALQEKYDNLPREGLRGKTEGLIEKLQRQDRLFELVDLVKEERPNAPWDDIFASNN